MVKFEEINLNNKHYYNQANEAFEIFGKIKVSFDGSTWTHDEIYYDKSYSKKYDNEQEDLVKIIEDENHTIIFAFEDNDLLGQMSIRASWNRFCFIDLLMVKEKARGSGLAAKLLEYGEAWAKHRKLNGFMLETHDTNLGACKFYFKHGFGIGGIDQKLYSNLATKKEVAVFLYKQFET